MNFKEFFGDYRNVLEFYMFLQKFSKNNIRNNRDCIDLMFDLDEIFLMITLQLAKNSKNL